jgi:hypothetical protein
MQWDAVIDALIKVVVLAFLVERALAIIFDMKWIAPRLERGDLKPFIAIVVSITACFLLRIDALSPLAPDLAEPERLGRIGYFLTGLVVAGGSAGAVKLFQDVLGFRRTSREQLKAVDALERQAAMEEAEARVEKAKAEKAVAQATEKVASFQAVMPSTPVGGVRESMLAARMALRDMKIGRVA